jgi:23S rRNA (pseudouridine1915-N3)-methyltransferase
VADGERLPRRARRLNLLVLAVGKASKGPERDLAERYRERAEKAGRQLGIGAVAVREIADGAGPMRAADEGKALLAARPKGPLVVLDERGEMWTSMDLARTLQNFLDRGEPAATFAIGGADGHAAAVREAAAHVVSLGRITLPHLLARAILLEQLYRAVTIRLGHPYHRA